MCVNKTQVINHQMNSSALYFHVSTFIDCKFIWDLSGGLSLTIPAKLVCGGIAGAIAQTFSYPLDVTRRRMQLAMMTPETSKFAYVIHLFYAKVLCMELNNLTFPPFLSGLECCRPSK